MDSILGLGSIFTFKMLIKPQTRILSIIDEEINSSQENDDYLQNDAIRDLDQGNQAMLLNEEGAK